MRDDGTVHDERRVGRASEARCVSGSVFDPNRLVNVSGGVISVRQNVLLAAARQDERRNLHSDLVLARQ